MASEIHLFFGSRSSVEMVKGGPLTRCGYATITGLFSEARSSALICPDIYKNMCGYLLEFIKQSDFSAIYRKCISSPQVDHPQVKEAAPHE